MNEEDIEKLPQLDKIEYYSETTKEDNKNIGVVNIFLNFSIIGILLSMFAFNDISTYIEYYGKPQTIFLLKSTFIFIVINIIICLIIIGFAAFQRYKTNKKYKERLI